MSDTPGVVDTYSGMRFAIEHSEVKANIINVSNDIDISLIVQRRKENRNESHL